MNPSPKAIKQLLDEAGIHYRTNSRSYIMTCPLCNKHSKVYMLREGSCRFICFSCSSTARFQGKPEYLLTELLGQPISEIRKIIYEGEAMVWEGHQIDVGDLRDFFDDNEPAPVSEVPDTYFPLDMVDLGSKPFAPALAYLERRGIGPELIARYGIRYDPTQRRVIFPCYVDGRLKGWQARMIDPAEVTGEDGRVRHLSKILTSNPGMPGAGVLMFQDNLARSPHAVLTEGPVDAIKAHLCGGNVASMGKGILRPQLLTVACSGVRRVYVGFDPDAARDIMRVARELYDLELFYMPPPPGRSDLGDATPEEVLGAFRRAERFTPSRLFVHLKSPAWCYR